MAAELIMAAEAECLSLTDACFADACRRRAARRWGAYAIFIAMTVIASLAVFFCGDPVHE